MKAKKTTAAHLDLGALLGTSLQGFLHGLLLRACRLFLGMPAFLDSTSSLISNPVVTSTLEALPLNLSTCLPSNVQASLISCLEFIKSSLASHSLGWSNLALGHWPSFESPEAPWWSQSGKRPDSNPSSATEQLGDLWRFLEPLSLHFHVQKLEAMISTQSTAKIK